MKNTPKLSVIVPVYNTEKYLSKCIDSILLQEYKDFELLLVNDGSYDNSKMICDSYASKHDNVKVFHKGNEGVSKARNIGIKNANGQWVCFIDSDDWISENCFTEIIGCVDKYDVDFVIWGIKEFNKNFKKEWKMPISGYFNTKKDVVNLLMKCDMNDLLESPCNKLYRKDFIDNNNLCFNEDLSYLEDLRFNGEYIKLVKKGYAINKPFYNYRREYNRNTLSKAYPENMLEINNISIKLRKDCFLSEFTINEENYLIFLETKDLGAKIELILSYYNKNYSSRHRRRKWAELIKNNNINILKEKKIYRILKIKNVFFIDLIFLFRNRISKIFPSVLIFFKRV